jgi:hypothetical protein
MRALQQVAGAATAADGAARGGQQRTLEDEEKRLTGGPDLIFKLKLKSKSAQTLPSKAPKNWKKITGWQISSQGTNLIIWVLLNLKQNLN